ncbi:MAG: hypothetical protein JO227_15460 [Acetobacteraceae bacterium]|nr:hypothetical protein [Acetobacteraceae bacterium]
MRKVLSELLPEDLYYELNSKGPKDYVTVTTIWDLLRWRIAINGYTSPPLTRETLYNACVNDAAWNHYRRLGPLTGEVHSLDDMSVHNQEEDMYLTDNNGDTVVDQRYGPIRVKDYPLPSEEAESVASAREVFQSPDLLKLVSIGDGNVAAQFAFDVIDTPAAAWCTAWTVWGNSIAISRVKLDVRFLSGRNGQAVSNADVVPIWFGFPPGRTLESIKE